MHFINVHSSFIPDTLMDMIILNTCNSPWPPETRIAYQRLER